MGYAIRTCAREGCANRFMPQSGRQRFCSPVCRHVARGYSDAPRAGARRQAIAGLEPRTCDWCGERFAPRATNQRFCCRAHREAGRAVIHRELYTVDHRKLRRLLEPRVAMGTVTCSWPGCGKPIRPGEAWDLGHLDGQPGVYAGPQHASCNRKTGGIQPTPPQRWSREW